MQIAEVITGPQGQSAGIVAVLSGGWLGHWLGYLPGTIAAIGGLFAIAWYIVMLWESKTVQDWHARSSARHKIKRIAKLQAAVKIATAQLEALEVRRVARVDAADKINAAAAEAALVQVRGETAKSVAELNTTSDPAMTPEAPADNEGDAS